MSDHYLFQFRFDVRKDAPASLHTALSKLALGEVPQAADLSDLPRVVQDYLTYAGAPGDGVQLYQWRGPVRKYRDGVYVEADFEDHEGSHSLRMSRTFHDDEYYNGGMYFPYWLFQFAANAGPIATMQQINGNDLPMIISKDGDRLIETRLAYYPERFWHIGDPSSPDAENPVLIDKSTNLSLSEMLGHLEMFRDGYCPD